MDECCLTNQRRGLPHLVLRGIVEHVIIIDHVEGIDGVAARVPKLHLRAARS